MPEYDLPEVVIPVSPRARRMAAQRRAQRRLQPEALPDVEEITGPEPGPANESGRSEQDVEVSSEEMRRRISMLAENVTNAAGQAIRGVLPALPAAPAQQPATAPAPPPAVASAPAQMAARVAQTAPATAVATPQAQPTVTTPPNDEDEVIEPVEPIALGRPEVDHSRQLPRHRTTKMKSSSRHSERYRIEDEHDRSESAAIAEQRRRAQIASLIAGLVSDRVTPDVARAMVGPYDPNAPLDRRAQQRRAVQEREDSEWRQALEERRIAQAESAVQQRAGYRDMDIMPDHPNAEQQRVMYSTGFAALPQHIREALPGFNPADPSVRARLAQMGAAQVREFGEDLRWNIEQRFPNDRQWRSTVTAGGRGPAARGRLAGDLQVGGGPRVITRGDAGLTPEDLEAIARGEAVEAPATSTTQRAQPRSTPRGGAPRPDAPAPAPGSQPAAEAAPQGRPIWERPPTREEIAADPRRASQERLVRMFARENHLDIDNVDDRRAAAGAVNDMTPAQVGELTNRASVRQTEQHAIIMRQVEPRIRGYDVLSTLSSRVSAASRTQLYAALHGGPTMSSVAGASELRAEINDFVNDYMHEMSGAAVSDGEMARFKSALGTDSVSVPPQAFIAFLRRKMSNVSREIDSFAAQYPEGWERYIENHRAARGR